MIFYPRYVADLQKKTSQFSMLERGALDSLLDHLYAQETPYIESLARAVIIARATSKAEKTAVQYVLNQCFELVDGNRYFQERAAIEIPKAQAKIATAQQNGRLGGRPKQPNRLPSRIPNRQPDGLSIQNQNQNQMNASDHHVANNNDIGQTVEVTGGPTNHIAARSENAGSCGGDGTNAGCSHVVSPEISRLPDQPAFDRICRELALNADEAKQLSQELKARIAIGNSHPELRILHVENWLKKVVEVSRNSGQQILRAGVELAQKEESDSAREKSERIRIEEAREEAIIARQRTDKTVEVISCAKENQLQLIADRAASLLPTTSRTKFEAFLRASVSQRKLPTGIGGSVVKRAVEELGLISMAGE